jgi:hypothetical protein
VEITACRRQCEAPRELLVAPELEQKPGKQDCKVIFPTQHAKQQTEKQ